jgi:hypothetical protein
MTEVVCHEVAPQSDWVKSLLHVIPVDGSRTRALGGVEYSVLLPREIRYEQTVLQNGITGNHTIATIAFKALEPGSTTLHLSVVTLVFLLDEHMDRFLLDGYVTVADTHVQDPPIIPEFSLPIFLVLFTTSAALSAVFTRKGRFRVLPQTHV